MGLGIRSGPRAGPGTCPPPRPPANLGGIRAPYVGMDTAICKRFHAILQGGQFVLERGPQPGILGEFPD